MRSHARIEGSEQSGGGPWLRREKWSGERVVGFVCLIHMYVHT